MDSKQKDIAEAAQGVAELPDCKACMLPSGRSLKVHRLSWLDFEQVWQAACSVLAALLLAEDEITDERLAAELAAAPQVVTALAAKSAKLDPAELGSWAYDDVLAAAAAAARLNFVDSRGLRDFFSVAGQIAGPEAVQAKTGR